MQLNIYANYKQQHLHGVVLNENGIKKGFSTLKTGGAKVYNPPTHSFDRGGGGATAPLPPIPTQVNMYAQASLYFYNWFWNEKEKRIKQTEE